MRSRQTILFSLIKNNRKGMRGMITMEGEMLRNKFTHDLFKIKKVENEKVVMLEDERGFIRIWLPKEHLEVFFDKVAKGDS